MRGQSCSNLSVKRSRKGASVIRKVDTARFSEMWGKTDVKDANTQKTVNEGHLQ